MRGTCAIVKCKCEKKISKKKTNKENLVSESVIMFLTHPFNIFSTACELARYIGNSFMKFKCSSSLTIFLGPFSRGREKEN